MSMLQKIQDGRADFRKKHGQEPLTATLTFDEGFKLLEEVRNITKGKNAYEAMTKVLLSRDEEDLIKVFIGSKIFGMDIEIKRVM